jgi:hypothetical protein
MSVVSEGIGKIILLWVCVLLPAGLMATEFWNGRLTFSAVIVVVCVLTIMLTQEYVDRVRATGAILGFAGIMGLARIAAQSARSWASGDMTLGSSLGIQGIAYAALFVLGWIIFKRVSGAKATDIS